MFNSREAPKKHKSTKYKKCPHCHANGHVFPCPKCERRGCWRCMPGGSSGPCPECSGQVIVVYDD